MAADISFGVNGPSALPYLIAEDILPQNPRQSLYHWTVCDEDDEQHEEEVLRTDHCVIWSQGGLIRRVFRFTRDGPKVEAALLARFTSAKNASSKGLGQPGTSQTKASSPAAAVVAVKQRPFVSTWGTKSQHEHKTTSCDRYQTNEDKSFDQSRALVIFLDGEVHVHFLNGSSHVIGLPFAVEKALPTPEGLLIQRRHEAKQHSIPSPHVPSAPPNSFFSSQAQIASQARTSFLEPPSVSLHTPNQVSSLRSVFQASIENGDEDTPLLYSMKDPLSGFCPLSQASLAYQPQRSRSGDTPQAVEYDDIDQSEHMLYVSSADELDRGRSDECIPLLLLVTLNAELRQVTVWQGWYPEPQSLSSLISQRATVKATRAKRGNSFVSAATGTGVTTPLPRHRDRARENYAATARLPMDAAAPQRQSMKAASKPLQDDEEAMASQMDPDFQASKNTGKGTRRISSLLSRGDLATADARGHGGSNASFAAPGRRSFGPSHDRRSLGGSTYRRSRGSTPGSIFNRSIGPEDDLMDVEGSLSTQVVDDDTTAVEELFRATQSSAGVDSVLGYAADIAKQDFVVRRLYSIPLGPTAFQNGNNTSGIGDSFKVVTLHKDQISNIQYHRIAVQVLNKTTQEMSVLSLRISKRCEPEQLPVPFIEGIDTVNGCHEMFKVRQARVTAIVTTTTLGSRRIDASNGSRPFTTTIDHNSDLNLYAGSLGRSRREQVVSSGPNGVGSPFRLILRPRSSQIYRVLEICRFALRGEEGQIVHQLWITIHGLLCSRKLCSSKPEEAEWEALVVTLFSFIVGSIGNPVTRTHKDTRYKQETSSPRYQSREAAFDGDRLQESRPPSASTAWDWMYTNKPGSRTRSTTSTTRRKTRKSHSSAGSAVRSMTELEARARHILHDLAKDGLEWLSDPAEAETRYLCTIRILSAVHLYREERKLTVLKDSQQGNVDYLVPALAQIGRWLRLDAWDWRPGSYLELEGATDEWDFSNCRFHSTICLLL